MILKNDQYFASKNVTFLTFGNGTVLVGAFTPRNMKSPISAVGFENHVPLEIGQYINDSKSPEERNLEVIMLFTNPDSIEVVINQLKRAKSILQKQMGIKEVALHSIAHILKEREEQIEKHGRTPERDIIENQNGQLAEAAQALLCLTQDEQRIMQSMPKDWDFLACAKMAAKPYKERLIIAGALIAAEIDRLNETK